MYPKDPQNSLFANGTTVGQRTKCHSVPGYTIRGVLRRAESVPINHARLGRDLSQRPLPPPLPSPPPKRSNNNKATTKPSSGAPPGGGNCPGEAVPPTAPAGRPDLSSAPGQIQNPGPKRPVWQAPHTHLCSVHSTLSIVQMAAPGGLQVLL